MGISFSYKFSKQGSNYRCIIGCFTGRNPSRNSQLQNTCQKQLLRKLDRTDIRFLFHASFQDKRTKHFSYFITKTVSFFIQKICLFFFICSTNRNLIFVERLNILNMNVNNIISYDNKVNMVKTKGRRKWHFHKFDNAD